ncbi:hypothetical protein [Streptomyces californicus]|uniref:hypothetical protein n=1 Tax=Streptomyces californicus TaxID=67351 RepID=UPI00378D9562
MEDDPPWWGILAIAAGVTVVLAAILLSVIAVVALCVLWLRSRRSRRPSAGVGSRSAGLRGGDGRDG